jgi:hypothetical protein
MMKCLCGYEKAKGNYVQIPILYSKGKNKGEVKSYSHRWVDPDYDKPDFIEFRLPSRNDCVYEAFACPECGTIKVIA